MDIFDYTFLGGEKTRKHFHITRRRDRRKVMHRVKYFLPAQHGRGDRLEERTHVTQVEISQYTFRRE